MAYLHRRWRPLFALTEPALRDYFFAREDNFAQDVGAQFIVVIPTGDVPEATVTPRHVLTWGREALNDASSRDVLVRHVTDEGAL